MRYTFYGERRSALQHNEHISVPLLQTMWKYSTLVTPVNHRHYLSVNESHQRITIACCIVHLSEQEETFHRFILPSHRPPCSFRSSSYPVQVSPTSQLLGHSRSQHCQPICCLHADLHCLGGKCAYNHSHRPLPLPPSVDHLQPQPTLPLLAATSAPLFTFPPCRGSA